MAIRDPLAELAAEIDAENLAENQKTADAESGEDKAADKGKKAAAKDEPKKPLNERNPAPKKPDDPVEEDDDETDDDQQDDDSGDKFDAESADDKDVLQTKEPPEKKSKERLIPVSERNAAMAKLRKAETALEAANAEINALKAAKPTLDADGKPVAKTEEELRTEIAAQAKAEARAEIQVERFLTSGYDEYGRKEFDDLCNTLSEMGAPNNLVPIAIAATGTPESAAKAIFQLSQLDPEQIEEILVMPVIRQGAALARLVTARPKKAAVEQDDDDDAPKIGKKAGQVSKATPPVRPLKGANKVPEGLGDDVPEDVFTERLFKELEKPRSPYSH